MVSSCLASTLNNRVTILCCSAEQQQTPRTQTPTQKQDANVLRPARRRLRWQWSKGDGPGEYGGPPLDFNIRKFSWKDRDVDPISSNADYIWNKEWRSHLSLEEEAKPSTPSLSKETASQAGFLSLNRSMALERIDVDLSKELIRPKTSGPTLNSEPVPAKMIQQNKPRWKMAPTRQEQKAWSQARKQMGMAVLASDGGEGQLQEFKEKRLATSKKEYNHIKGNLELFTVLFGVLGSGIAYASYSTEVASSYGVGLLGSVAYLRMLGNSVDSLGQSSAQGVIRGAVGQPRLLVPVILVMLFNRWNELLVPEYGMPQLQLIPILIGFFTYKAATVFEVFKDVLEVALEERERESLQ